MGDEMGAPPGPEDGGELDQWAELHAELHQDDLRLIESTGLTYQELADQARRGEFSSPDARKVWIAIHGHDAKESTR